MSKSNVIDFEHASTWLFAREVARAASLLLCIETDKEKRAQIRYGLRKAVNVARHERDRMYLNPDSFCGCPHGARRQLADCRCD